MKNPDYRDTMYVTDLVVANTVNTMPEKTMQAFADHGEVKGDQVTGHYAEAQQVMDDLARLGIDYDDVIEVLETEGVDKFVKSWDELDETVRGQLDRRGTGRSERDVRGRRHRRGRRRDPRPGAGAGGGRLREQAVREGRDAVGPRGRGRVRKRLSWVALPRTSRPLVGEVSALRSELAEAGVDHVVLCGMGGSSLAPEVICATSASS